MLKFACIAALCLSQLNHCMMGPAPVPGPYYVPPNVAEEPTAFLTGSLMSGLAFTRIPAFPFAIDGIRVQDGVNFVGLPLVIRPGIRTITAELNLTPHYARADLTFAAQPGEDYVIKFTTDVGPSGGNSFCEFWVVNSKTGKSVTGVTRANVMKR